MHSSQFAIIIPPPAPPVVVQRRKPASQMPPPVAGSTPSSVVRLRWKTPQTVPQNPPATRAAEAPRTTIRERMVLRPLPSKKNVPAKAVRFYHYQSIKQRIEDSPSWLVSMVVHLFLLLVLALITTSSGDVGRVLLTISQSKDQVTTEIVEFTIEPIVLEDIPTNDFLETKVDLDIVPIQIVEHLQFASLAVTPEAAVMSDALPSSKEVLFTKVASMFSGRSGAMKQKLLQESGGTQATEDAVVFGLAWLKRQQLKDGSWSLLGPYADGARNENQVSATAMAMIAFMGAGSTHRGGEYQKELWQAVRWLVNQQDRQGFMAVQAADHEKMYSQAQAMIALCELYAMTGDSWIRPYAQASCDFACRAQSPEGGWRYKPRFDSDTSVTGWFVMGLKSGEAAGLQVDHYIWPKVEKYLDSVSAKPENRYYAAVGYSYKVGDIVSPSMTAEGLLCRQYMGWHRNMSGMGEGLGALAHNHPINFGEPDVYYWYYATQSLHHYGGPLWTQWNDKLKVELPAKQEMQGKERGSWAPQNDAWGRHAGRLYTTCFSLYCLEVYYRHMPLYDPNEDDDA